MRWGCWGREAERAEAAAVCAAAAAGCCCGACAPEPARLPAAPGWPRLAAEAAQGERHHTATQSFLQAAAKDVYAAGGSVADTVGRRAAFSERGGSGAAFCKGG